MIGSIIEVKLCLPLLKGAPADGVMLGGVCLDNRLCWSDLAPRGI